MLTTVGTGALVRSTPWFAGTTAISVVAYGAVAIPRFDQVWLQHGIGLGASIVLGSVLHLVVRRATAKLEVARRALETQAGTDALTGLPNRRALPALFARASATTPVALLFVDVDRLKDVNDEAGHAAGDALIVGVGRALAGAFRGTDTVVRVGGDEFVVVLPGVNPEEAEAFARRAELACSVTAPYGVSVGVASSHAADGMTLDALLTAADHAMYAVKTQRGSQRAPSATRSAYSGCRPT
jgi:diguanylate cyclase (GGDEF)-like protein